MPAIKALFIGSIITIVLYLIIFWIMPMLTFIIIFGFISIIAYTIIKEDRDRNKRPPFH